MSGGILTRISICKTNSWNSNSDFDLKKEINGILDDIGNFVDISKYELKESVDGYDLNLKVDYINKNIYALLIEMSQISKIFHFVDMDYDVSSIDDKYIKEHPITCFIEDDHYVLKYGAIIPIWIDCYKIFSDDEIFILTLMNTMKTKYFDSELSKCLIFEVLG